MVSMIDTIHYDSLLIWIMGTTKRLKFNYNKYHFPEINQTTVGIHLLPHYIIIHPIIPHHQSHQPRGGGFLVACSIRLGPQGSERKERCHHLSTDYTLVSQWYYDSGILIINN